MGCVEKITSIPWFGFIALIFTLNFSEGVVAHVDVSSRLTSQNNIFKIEHLSKSHKNIL